MKRKQLKSEIKQLKGQIHAIDRKSDSRLLKLTFVFIVLLIATWLLYDKITF